MIELFEHSTVAELCEDNDSYILGGGQLNSGRRRLNDECTVLEELGQVKRNAGRDQSGYDTSRPADRTERLRLERMTDHDVSVDGESEGEPDGADLECDGGWVEVREHVRVEITVVTWRPASRLWLRTLCVLTFHNTITMNFIMARFSDSCSKI